MFCFGGMLFGRNLGIRENDLVWRRRASDFKYELQPTSPSLHKRRNIPSPAISVFTKNACHVTYEGLESFYPSVVNIDISPVTRFRHKSSFKLQRVHEKRQLPLHQCPTLIQHPISQWVQPPFSLHTIQFSSEKRSSFKSVKLYSQTPTSKPTKASKSLPTTNPPSSSTPILHPHPINPFKSAFAQREPRYRTFLVDRYIMNVPNWVAKF